MEANARTVVSPLRFSKCNMLHFLGGAVAMELKRTYLLVLTNGKTTARPPVIVCLNNTGLQLKTFFEKCSSSSCIFVCRNTK
jgi:hypothetical protein